MKSIGIVLRKIQINKSGERKYTPRNQYRKQLITLLKKLKKNDPTIHFQYSIEKDPHSRFHVHVIINYNNFSNLYSGLSRFIGGKGSLEKKDELNQVYTIQGKYGEIDCHPIYDLVGFQQYINKYNPSEQLF